MKQFWAAVDAIKTAPVEVGGAKFLVRNTIMLWDAEFARRVRVNQDDAIAYLLRRQVLKPDMTPAFTEEEALRVATGAAEVADPLVRACMGLTAKPSEKNIDPEPAEKKSDSNPPSSSTTA